MASRRAAARAAEQILQPQRQGAGKPFLENIPLAVTLTALAVLAGLVFGAHRSVARQAAQVEACFSEGTDGSGYSIAGDLRDRMEYATNLSKIALRYDLNTPAAAVSEAVSALDSAQGAADRCDADRALGAAVESLNGALLSAGLSEQDEGYRLEYYRNFVSTGDTISHEAVRYNELVADFNRNILGAFPTGTIAGLTGVEELEAFE